MRRRLVPLLLAVVALLACVGVARATTGSTAGFPEPKVIVPVEKATPFEGRYILSAVGRGANIRSGEMKVEFSEGSSPEFLAGAIQVYEYNEEGEVEAALFDLYPFSPTPRGVAVRVLRPGLGGYGQTTHYGRMTFATPSDEKSLKGTIELHGNGPYPVVFRRLAEGATTNGSPPPAEQLSEASSEPKASGWGAEAAAYEGEYELTNPAPDATEGAGVLAAVIGVAQGLGGGGTPVNSGSMSVTAGASPSAEVTLESNGRQLTYRLTDLKWLGDLRVARAESEGANAETGEFEGRQVGAGEIKGALEAGESHFQVDFKRSG